MRKLLIGSLLLSGLLALPVWGQDENQGEAPAQPQAVADVKTFSLVMVQIADENSQVAIRVDAEGRAFCRHMTQETLADGRKTTVVDVETKLSDEDLSALKAAFEKLDVSHTDDAEMDPELKGIVIIKAAQFLDNGKILTGFKGQPGNLGKTGSRVKAFLDVVVGIADKLK